MNYMLKHLTTNTLSFSYNKTCKINITIPAKAERICSRQEQCLLNFIVPLKLNLRQSILHCRNETLTVRRS